MKVVVIGSGIAGVSFAEELHKLSPTEEVTLLTAETAGYYSRPLLSHGFTREDIETRIILRRFPDLAATGIDIRSGIEVLAIDPERQRVRYSAPGTEVAEIPYDRLILAPGSAALVPPPFQASSGLFQVLNSYQDLIELRRLRERVRHGGDRPNWAVVGGGLIGCEVASDLARAGDRVTLFHALPRLMERQLVPEDSASLLNVLRDDLDIDVRLDANVQGFAGDAGKLTVLTETSPESGFHGILVACGFKPRTDLARDAGLATRRGILVDAYLATTVTGIYAVGDVAEFANGKLYAYVTPVRSQALWLARHLAGQADSPWEVPPFAPRAKVHGFTAAHPYLF